MIRKNTLEYNVLSKDGEFEIRKYDAFYIVEHENKSKMGMNGVYNDLLNYMNYDNDKGVKLDLVTPVLVKTGNDRKIMAIVVPKKYKGDVPSPLKKELRVQYIDSAIYVAIRYRGAATTQNINRHIEKLNHWVESHNLIRESGYIRAYYDPQLSVSFLRRNEILVEVSADNLIGPLIG